MACCIAEAVRSHGRPQLHHTAELRTNDESIFVQLIQSTIALWIDQTACETRRIWHLSLNDSSEWKSATNKKQGLRWRGWQHRKGKRE